MVINRLRSVIAKILPSLFGRFSGYFGKKFEKLDFVGTRRAALFKKQEAKARDKSKLLKLLNSLV